MVSRRLAGAFGLLFPRPTAGKCATEGRDVDVGSDGSGQERAEEVTRRVSRAERQGGGERREARETRAILFEFDQDVQISRLCFEGRASHD